jgi:hypothetical protein
MGGTDLPRSSWQAAGVKPPPEGGEHHDGRLGVLKKRVIQLACVVVVEAEDRRQGPNDVRRQRASEHGDEVLQDRFYRLRLGRRQA